MPPGIELQILHTLIKEWCPGCAHDALIPMQPPKQLMVMIKDWMMEARNRYGPRFDCSFTGKEFFDMLIIPVRKYLESGRYCAVVLCIDQPAFVPPEKKATQDGRDADSQSEKAKHKVEPYDWRPGQFVLINDEGIRFQANGPFELFHVGRLFLTRPLRDKLWQYIQHRLMSELFPEGTTVIMDYSLEGPYINDADVPRHLPTLRHDIGEGELACLFWARIFHHYPVVIKSGDSDVLPICLSFLATQEPRRTAPLYWQFKEGRYMDMHHCYRLLGSHMRWSVFDFLVGVALCGCDYTHKPFLTHQIGWAYIFYVIQRVKDQPFWLNVHRFSWHMEHFLSILYTAYTHQRDSDDHETVKWAELLLDPTDATSKLPSLDSIRETFVAKRIVKFRVPDHDTVKLALKQIRFLLRYWIRDFNGVSTTGFEALRANAVPIQYNDQPAEAMKRTLERLQTVMY